MHVILALSIEFDCAGTTHIYACVLQLEQQQSKSIEGYDLVGVVHDISMQAFENDA